MRLNDSWHRKLLIIFLSIASPSVFAEYQRPNFNMTPGVTSISHDIYTLHMTIFTICCVIGVIVFGALIYSLIFHRKSRGVAAAEFHEHTTVEVLWAIIPFLILVAMAIPATIVIQKFNNIPDSALTVKVTGYQWKWQYQYMDQGISYFSNLSTPMNQILNKAPKDKWYLLEVDHPIVLPIHEKIRFLITANDVIHSWWVPALGIKRDAIPGFIHEAWAEIDEPGTYRGQCAELCGVNHGFMPIVVVAKTEADFKKWVAEQQKTQAQATSLQKMTFDQLMKLGQATYGKYCVACHQVTGLGLPPVYPALKSSSVVVGRPITRHLDTVLNGVPGTAMQAFGPQLTNPELAAVITYERNAFDNKSGDVVQPSDIQKERQRLQQGGTSAATHNEHSATPSAQPKTPAASPTK